MSEPSASAVATTEKVSAGCMPPWDVGELPQPPEIGWNPRSLLGPGLLMTGAAIGAGEWLAGPAMTSQYGGSLMWLALISILLQAVYNLEVMRYTLYCGEPILTGCFRLRPGPMFWTFVYLALDFGAIWPYLSANAAVPLTAVFLGHIPGATVDIAGQPIPETVQQHELAIKLWVSCGIFLSVFVPLIFGGKVYNALEKVMVAKLVLVLGYLTLLCLFLVPASSWYDLFSGFIGSPALRDGRFSFQWLPELPAGEPLDFALLATFAAIAGAGGLSNTVFSAYTRDKGWGMGPLVGALPSAVGGGTIKLSHVGKVFHVSQTSLVRWRGWLKIIRRDQWAIWVIGCILGMAIPSLVSLEFTRDLGRKVTGDELAAVTAKLISERTGIEIFWWLTLLCGFMVLAPSQVSTIDGIARRWTDIIWTGIPSVHRLDGGQVRYVYYGLLVVYGAFGLTVLIVYPKPLALVKIASVIFNYALGFSALHTLALNCRLLPRELRPGWLTRMAMVTAFVFFTVVSGVATKQALDDFNASRAKTAADSGRMVLTPPAAETQFSSCCSFLATALESRPFSHLRHSADLQGWEPRNGFQRPGASVAHVVQRRTT